MCIWYWADDVPSIQPLLLRSRNKRRTNSFRMVCVCAMIIMWNEALMSRWCYFVAYFHLFASHSLTPSLAIAYISICTHAHMKFILLTLVWVEISMFNDWIRGNCDSALNDGLLTTFTLYAYFLQLPNIITAENVEYKKKKKEGEGRKEGRKDSKCMFRTNLCTNALIYHILRRL
jgi:hypothetical protein